MCYGSGATSEYRLEVAVLEGSGSLWPTISGRRGRPPPTICARLDRPVNAAESFDTKKTLQQTFFEKSPIYYAENKKIAFEAPLGVRGNVRCSS